MNKLSKFSTLAITAMLLLGLMAAIPVKSYLGEGPKIYITPDPITETTTSAYVGKTFNVSIWIDNVTTADAGLDGWQIELHYNHNLLNVTKDSLGPRAWPSAVRGANKFAVNYVFFSALSVGSSLSTPVYGNVNPTESYILLGDAIIIGSPWKGNGGLMAKIEFEIMYVPGKLGDNSTVLDITNAFSWIKQGGNTDNRAYFDDGLYQISWVAPANPHMGLVLPNGTNPHFLRFGPLPPAALGASFDVTFSIDSLYSAWFLTSAVFTVNYNATVIDVNGGAANVTIAPLWTTSAVAYAPGTITISVNTPSSNPGGTPADVLVATIKFTVKKQMSVPPQTADDYDYSTITITGVAFVDHVGPIPADASESGLVRVYALLPIPPPWFEVRDPVDGDNMIEMGPAPVIGDTFDVDVVITGPPPEGLHPNWYLVAVQFRLFYPTALVEPVAVAQGPFLKDGPWNLYGTFPVFSFESDGLGPHVLAGDILLPNTTSGEYDQTSWPNGTGTLFRITFRVLAQNTAPCTFTWENMTDIFYLTGVFDEWGVDYKGNYLIVQDPVPADYVIYDTTSTGRFIDLYGGAWNSGYGAYPFPAPYGGQGPDNPMDLVFPQSEIKLYVKVEYNCWPVQSKDVGFEIEGPYEHIGDQLVPKETYKIWAKLTARTGTDGIAVLTFRMPWPCEDPESITGVWLVTATVSLADVVIMDTMPFYYEHLVDWVKVTTDKYYYAHDEWITVEVCYQTHSMQYYPALFAIVLTDELGVPFYWEKYETQVGGAVFCTWKPGCFTVRIWIPKWAYAGFAYVHVSVYDKDPTIGGFPYTYEYAPPPEIYILAE